MAIGSPRWGGIRPDPYNPDSPDADNDGIVQEGTLFERPAGTRIVSALTGLELGLGTPGTSIQDTRNTLIVDREGRPVPYRQSWSGGTLSAREQNGTIGDRVGGTIGSLFGNLDGPPPAPKRDMLVLRATDVDKDGKPLRVFVPDDRRLHGVEALDHAGFPFPGRREAEAHWATNANGLLLPKNETPISPTDPRLPETLFIPSPNPNAHRDLQVVRADDDSKKVTAYVTRQDALQAWEDLVEAEAAPRREAEIDAWLESEGWTRESWLERGYDFDMVLDEIRQDKINEHWVKNGYTWEAWLEAGDLYGGRKVGDRPAEAPEIITYPRGFGNLVESAFRARNPGLAAWLDRDDADDTQEALFDIADVPVETPLGQLREEYSSFSQWMYANFKGYGKDRPTDEELGKINTQLQSTFGQALDPDFKPHTLRDPNTGRFIVQNKNPELPFADVVEVPVDNIATGAAVTFTPHTVRDPETGRFVKASQVHVYGDVRVDTEAAPEPVRREANIPTPDSLDPIKERFDAAGFELYLVGGAVRDTLMGRKIKDYDLASNATPDEIEAMLADVPGARLDLTGKDFAVVRVNMPDGEEYEIATFRRDVGEGRRPDEVEFTTIDEDVRRRDLTMNALFYDLSTNEIVDYVGGIDDIENGVVRAVGDPAERFREDPLRILRAFRFSGRTGWGMDSATVDAIRANSALRGVSGERVRDEFVRGIDSAVSPSGYIRQIDIVDNGTGAVWGQVFPGLNVSPDRLPDDGSYSNRAALVASLLADNDIEDVKTVLKDRKFTNDEIADVELIMQARSINDGNVATLKNKFGKNRRVSGDDMRAFHRVQPETEDDIEPFLQFADAPPALTANELQDQGIKPGPQFGAMLREAEEQRYREIRDNFSTGNPGHDEGEAPPLPDAPDKLFVGSSNEKNVPQSPDEVRAHMESAGFGMTDYDGGKSLGVLRGDVDDPYDDRIFFTVEEGPDGGSTIRRLSVREVGSSQLVQTEVEARTSRWRRGVASRGRAWHAVRNFDNNYGRSLQGLRDDEPNPAQPVAETIDSIRNEGLVPRTVSRVDSNQGIGDAVFLSESRAEIDHFADPHLDADGNEQPTALLEIDLGRALDDGAIVAEDLSPEPLLFEGQVVRDLSERLGGSVFASDAFYDITGVTEQSIVLTKPIPNDYISINGRNIRDVGMRDLQPYDPGHPEAAAETPAADLPERVVPEGRNWERKPLPYGVDFQQMLYPKTNSGYKGHVYSTSDAEVDEVLDRIYDTAVERGWGMKIAEESFWDATNDFDPRNRRQRGKGVTVYFPRQDTWEDDVRELHRLMEGYEPAGDGDIDSDIMIGNGVGLRYEFNRDPGEDLDMNDGSRYEGFYRPARAPHNRFSKEKEDEIRRLAVSFRDDSPIRDILADDDPDRQIAAMPERIVTPPIDVERILRDLENQRRFEEEEAQRQRDIRGERDWENDPIPLDFLINDFEERRPFLGGTDDSNRDGRIGAMPERIDITPEESERARRDAENQRRFEEEEAQRQRDIRGGNIPLPDTYEEIPFEQRQRPLLGGADDGPTSVAGQAPRASEFPVFNNATAILEDISEAYPSMSSSVDKAADSLFDRADESPGYIYRTPQQMQDLRESAQSALDNLINYYEENPDPDVDLDDPDTPMGHYAAALRMHIDLLDEQFEADNAEYLDGYYDIITASYDPTDENLTDGIMAVIDSEEFQAEIRQALDFVNPELRSTSDIRIAATNRDGEDVNTYGAAYSFGDHAITMHPTLYADFFKDNGVPFDEFIAWADPNGTMTELERRNLQDFFNGEDKPDFRFSDTSLETARERVLLHENFHGIHALLTNGRIDNDPEWLELRERLMKDLKESGFFDEITPLGSADLEDASNYFHYLMRWMDHLGTREDVVDGWSEEDKADKATIDQVAGMEWFAEALSWISEGREFPGSDAIVDFVNAKLDLNLTETDRARIAEGSDSADLVEDVAEVADDVDLIPSQTAEAADPVSTMKQNFPNLDVSNLPTGPDGNPGYQALTNSTAGWQFSEDALNQTPLRRVYDSLGEDFMVDGQPLKELMTPRRDTDLYLKLPSTLGGEDDWFADEDEPSDFDKLRSAISELDDIDEELREQLLDDLDTARTLQQFAADLSNAMPEGRRGGPPPRNPSDAPAAPELPAPEEVQAKIDRIVEDLPDGFAEKFERLQEQQQKLKETVRRRKEIESEVIQELQRLESETRFGIESSRTENTPAAALKDKTAEVGNATRAKNPDIDVDDHEPVEGVNRGHAEIDELAVQAHQIADSLVSPEHRDELADVIRNNPAIVAALENLRERRKTMGSLTGGQLEYDQTNKTGSGYAGRELIQALIELRGFDGKNLRVTEDELEQVIYVSGAVPLSRGGNVELQKQHIENGDLPVGEGVDGAGLYFAVDRDAAPENVRNENTAAHDAATYAGPSGGVIRGAISPSANMTTIDRMRKTVTNYEMERENPGSANDDDPLVMLRREWASNPETADLVEALDLMLSSASTDNNGEFKNGLSSAALLLGYDGMNSYGTLSDNRVILLNRTAMLVSNEISSADDYREKRPWDKLTERAKLISESLDVPIGLEGAARTEYILDETARRLEALND
jgi:tRNA nucleotidyltransferase/poly(A) polymerase